jgi:hypothetical protein
LSLILNILNNLFFFLITKKWFIICFHKLFLRNLKLYISLVTKSLNHNFPFVHFHLSPAMHRQMCIRKRNKKNLLLTPIFNHFCYFLPPPLFPPPFAPKPQELQFHFLHHTILEDYFRAFRELDQRDSILSTVLFADKI